MAERHLVVVPHTHWDREWYATPRAVPATGWCALVDRLLDLLEGDPAFRHFTLDGQAIVLDDYLEVRPGERERIGKLVRDGRLRVGPWYVLPDEWLVSGEALIRNLRIGLARSAAFGPPDAPRLRARPLRARRTAPAALRRASASRPRSCGAASPPRWTRRSSTGRPRTARDSSRCTCATATATPCTCPWNARRCAGACCATSGQLEPWSRIPSLLLMNGSDHVEPQAGLPAALEAAVAELPGTSVEIGTLDDVRRAGARRGARRTARSIAASCARACARRCCRAAPRRAWPRSAPTSRTTALLTRLPRAARGLGRACSGATPAATCSSTRGAWRCRTTLTTRSAAAPSTPCTRRSTCALARVDADRGRAPRGDRRRARGERPRAGGAGRRAARASPSSSGIPTARGAARVDAELELDLPVSASGRIRPVPPARRRRAGASPASAELVLAGAVLADFELSAAGAGHLVDGLPPDFAGAALRAVRWRRAGERRLELELRLAAAGDLAPEAAKRRAARAARLGRVRSRAAARGASAPRAAAFRRRAAGPRPARLSRGPGGCAGRARGGSARRATRGRRRLLENAVWRVEVAAGGRVAARTIARAAGASTTRCASSPRATAATSTTSIRCPAAPSSIARSACASCPAGECRGVRCASRRATACRGSSTPSRRARSGAERRAPRRARAAPRAPGSTASSSRSTLDNTARDHRLRLLVARSVRRPRASRSSRRSRSPSGRSPRRPEDFGSPRPAEFPIGAGPAAALRERSTTARSRSRVANRGGGGGRGPARRRTGRARLALTLLRAVGWLSRPDLALRPGRRGPGPPDARRAGSGAASPGVRRAPAPRGGARAGSPRRCASPCPPLAFPGARTRRGRAPRRRGAPRSSSTIPRSCCPPSSRSRTVACRCDSGTRRGRRAPLRVAWPLPGPARCASSTCATSPIARLLARPQGGRRGRSSSRPWQIATLRARVRGLTAPQPRHAGRAADNFLATPPRIQRTLAGVHVALGSRKIALRPGESRPAADPAQLGRRS